MTEKTTYFEWSDAWVLASMSCYNYNYQPFDLSQIIAIGDLLNHAIFTPEELRQGIDKLICRGLIVLNEKGVRLTKAGINLLKEVRNGRGGLFSVVNRTLKRLNSPRLKLPYIEQKHAFNLELLYDEAIQERSEKHKFATNKD